MSEDGLTHTARQVLTIARRCGSVTLVLGCERRAAGELVDRGLGSIEPPVAGVLSDRFVPAEPDA